MSIDDIISTLTNNHGKFPRGALAEAIVEREKITPELLQAIEGASENIQKIEDDSTYILHIYALYLLSQFRETDAYLPIIRFFSIPGDVAMQVTGDVVTEDLGRILASTFNGDVEPIEFLVENRNLSEYVRAAGLHALCILWGCEEISRKKITEYYKFLLSEALDGETAQMWSATIANSFHFSPNEIESEIDQAFNDGLVENFYFNRDDFVGSLGLSNDEALSIFRERGRNRPIEDTISEMESWACFQTNKSRKIAPINHASRPGKQKVGRNDSCPCGSGRKFKKCCYKSSA